MTTDHNRRRILKASAGLMMPGIFGTIAQAARTKSPELFLAACLLVVITASVATAAAGLRYRDFVTVAVIIDREALFPDNWIYVHTPGVQVGRIQNFNNWSRAMVPERSRTCLGLEYFCFEDDEIWRMSDDEAVELGGVARIGEVGVVIVGLLADEGRSCEHDQHDGGCLRFGRPFGPCQSVDRLRHRPVG